MKKILLLTNENCGGAERVTVTFGKFLHAQGYDVTILIYKRDGDNDTCKIKKFIPPYIKVDYINGRYRLMLWKLKRYLQGSDYNVILSSLPPLNYINIILSKFYFRNIVSVVRVCNTPSTHPKLIRLLNKLLYRYADMLISQTDEMSDEMSDLYQIPRSEICTVYNPIDIDQIGFSIQETFETPSDYIKYVAVGRVQPQKDYTTLLQAFAKVLQRQPKSILYIVGDDKGEYASRQKVLMSELGISNNVFFEGFQANPYKYIYNSDCFVLSSQYEGLPNVMLEALYIGVPVVATASIPFIKKTLTDERYGICVPVGNVDLLAEAMIASAMKNKFSGFNITKDSFDVFLNELKILINNEY